MKKVALIILILCSGVLAAGHINTQKGVSFSPNFETANSYDSVRIYFYFPDTLTVPQYTVSAKMKEYTQSSGSFVWAAEASLDSIGAYLVRIACFSSGALADTLYGTATNAAEEAAGTATVDWAHLRQLMDSVLFHTYVGNVPADTDTTGWIYHPEFYGDCDSCQRGCDSTLVSVDEVGHDTIKVWVKDSGSATFLSQACNDA